MNTPTQPGLEPGRAYRTRELRPWSANPTRLARRLVDEGKLRAAAHGLYYAPVPSRFGPAPASDEALLRAFLGGELFLVTGPPYWNALSLGSTAMFAVTLVYNLRRSGEFERDRRRFLLRPVYFAETPNAERRVVHRRRAPAPPDVLGGHESRSTRPAGRCGTGWPGWGLDPLATAARSTHHHTGQRSAA